MGFCAASSRLPGCSAATELITRRAARCTSPPCCCLTKSVVQSSSVRGGQQKDRGAEQLCLGSGVSSHLSGWDRGNISESTFTSLFKVGLVFGADSCCCFSCSFCYLRDFAPSAQHSSLRGDQLTPPYAKAGDRPTWDQGNLRLATRKELRFQS